MKKISQSTNTKPETQTSSNSTQSQSPTTTFTPQLQAEIVSSNNGSPNNYITTVTSRDRIVKQWLSKQLHHHRYKLHKLIVGFGVQRRPPIQNKVATLQLCIGKKCLIFQISRNNSIPRALRVFLDSGSTSFVGVNNWSDEGLLWRDYKLRVGRVLELGGLFGLKGASMGRLAREFLGWYGIEKPEWVGRSEWDQRELSLEQVKYACVDAHVSFVLGRRLKAWRI
ncbi:hypothetical protein GIB67_021342 [Kingdonia uniflora]|uniref:3'-5' exonuclease domain-containing protein n=1 Tax=Kingdonia uniflora TaxID=39325 RepID=A0A7J7MCW0_9MAGN|nr:hypothetical protein GIB67_021342 [Kingdonia uniflora]